PVAHLVRVEYRLVPRRAHLPEIAELAGLERAQLPVHPDAVGAVECAHLQRLPRRHPAADHGPELPLAAQPVELAVTPQADVAPGPDDGGRGCRDARKHVLILAKPGPALGPLIDLLVGEEAPDLRVVVDVVALVEVVL